MNYVFGEAKKMKILVIGAGDMALHYCRVLKELQHTIKVVGNTPKTDDNFYRINGEFPTWGGLEKNINDLKTEQFDAAIVASPEQLIGNHTKLLLIHGFKKILVEKPGGFDVNDVLQVNELTVKRKAAVFVGYNRRFFASTKKAKSIIADDGGVLSFRFEFSEWGHVISGISKAEGVKDQWFLNNSTHIIDLSFHLCGWPEQINTFSGGDPSWHKFGSIFSGAGVSCKNAPFSYYANWSSPGNFSLEINTKSRRLLFSPIETLQQKLIGERDYTRLNIDDQSDKKFKPGLLEMVKSFLVDDQDERLLPIQQQAQNMKIFQDMRNDA